ncbi:hypothetical protein Tco_1315821 [Tanacetum coccineum]
MAEPILYDNMEKAPTESNLSITSNDINIELNKEFLVELRKNIYHGMYNEDVVDHIAKVLKMVDLIYVPGTDSHQLRMKIFPLSLADDAKELWISEGDGKITTWEELVETVYEDELKRSSGSNSASQNLAFLSSENTSSTNEVSTASGDFRVSTAGGINQVPSTPCAHDVAYSFLAQPTTSPQLENEDFQQMDGDDLEELDLRWQVAMLTVRVKKKGHLARECRFGRNQGKRSYGQTNAEKSKSASESVVSNPKINRDRVIIEDWNSDDEKEVYEVQTVRPETQTVKTRDDKSGQTSQKQGIGFKKCFSTARPVYVARPYLPKKCSMRLKYGSTAGLRCIIVTTDKGQEAMEESKKKQKARKGINIAKTAQDEFNNEREAFVKDRVKDASLELESRVDAIPTATKPPTIVNWKIISQSSQKAAYQIIRRDGSDKIYMSFGAILKDFSRDDLIELYRLVIKKYGENRPEEMYDRVLWGDLKTMFDPPLSDDAIWSLPLQQKIINWRYYPTCAVHCLTLDASTIYMLADRKYPLSKDACQVMLKMKLLDGTMDEVCYQLLKMIEKQAGIRK